MPAVRGDGMRGKITWIEMNFFVLHSLLIYSSTGVLSSSIIK